MIYIYTAIAGLLLGTIVKLFIFPRLTQWNIQRECLFQRKQMLIRANREKENIIRRQLLTAEKEIESQSESLNDRIEELKETLDQDQEEVVLKTNFLEEESQRLDELEAESATKAESFQSLKDKVENKQSEIDQLEEQTLKQLNQIVDTDQTALLNQLSNNMIEARKISAQKKLKQYLDQLEKDSGKSSNYVLARCLSRYAPNFYWPKMSNSVEIENPKVFEQVVANRELLNKLEELCEAKIETNHEDENQRTLLIRLSGGMGLKKEAARQALETMIKSSPNNWDKALDDFVKNEKKLMELALQLGKKAVVNLGIKDIHPELQRMVGFLNWRTSYRQNQLLHTWEVAKFAGIIAHEMDVDPEKAKRCGLLHDIGKSIDYRIDGGHAVISGDYADRWGETQEICDTVMSHHNELVIETPLAFILKTADTLSGARPGARVNLEEGYQTRLMGINDAIKKFKGVVMIQIMNGGREVHVVVDHKKVADQQLEELASNISKKITEEVAFPGQIKVLVSRKFEAAAVA